MTRQRLHLKAPDNWVNDPNGFIYYKGMYHMFYQYFPYAPRWGTMHWGHAVSRDLVNWEHVGIALFPTKRGDQNGCFSGSAVEKEGRLHLLYTGICHEENDPEDIHANPEERFVACQMRIVSEDGFHFDNWTDKHVAIPVIRNEKTGDKTHTRDPKVWRGTNAWYLILGSTVEKEQGRVLFYRSEDLEKWDYVNQTGKGPGFGWMWECPDYFEVDGGKALLISPMGFLKNREKEQNQAIGFLVDFEETSCEMKIPDNWQFLDYGMDLYAPQTALDAEGRRTLMGWIRMPKPTKEGWIGMFTAPRLVEIRDGKLCFPLHPNVRAACSREIPDVWEAHPEGYRAVFSLEEGEEVSLGGFSIWRRGNRICTDRSHVFPPFAGAHLKSETPELSGEIHLEVLVDENLVEVFVNHGEAVISNATYGLGKEISGSVHSGIKLYTL